MILGGFQIVLLVLFALFVRYPEATGKTFVSSGDQVQYLFYLDVTVMMIVGFGFLMAFLSKYPLGAVGYTFLITAMIIPWGILTGRAFYSMCNNPIGSGSYPDARVWNVIHVDTNALLNGNFAAATILISFGAVIGKISPSQLAVMAIIECVCLHFNKEVVNLHFIGVLDMGGTVLIHLFGAYFGLSVSYVLGPPKSTDDAKTTHVSDLFSLIGTVFLWIFWPSFNGATAGFSTGHNSQTFTTANTVLALCGSCMWTFIMSRVYNKGGISAADIQNATLAGGVAVGAASNMAITPVGALLVGAGAGIISTTGFNRIQAKVEEMGVHDSCGVHNLHGMPALFGGMVVAVVVIGQPHSQPFRQVMGVVATFFCAIITGTLTGFIIKHTSAAPLMPFRDAAYWLGVAHEDDDKKPK